MNRTGNSWTTDSGSGSAVRLRMWSVGVGLGLGLVLWCLVAFGLVGAATDGEFWWLAV